MGSDSFDLRCWVRQARSNRGCERPSILMARHPRYALPGQPQHVILRGNNRQETFCANANYRFFPEKLRAACAKHACDLHAYVLMTNHVHLLITELSAQGLSEAVQSLGRYYVQYFNYCYKRTGTLWEGRYKSTLIDGEQCLLTSPMSIAGTKISIESDPIDFDSCEGCYSKPFAKTTSGLLVVLANPMSFIMPTSKSDRVRTPSPESVAASIR